jgi:hypothetical protein
MVTEETTTPRDTPKRYSGWQLAFFVLLAVVVTMLVGGIVVYKTLFPGEFTPVLLTQKEQQKLDQKLQRLENLSPGTRKHSRTAVKEPQLQPEPYSEAGASREINLSEKELNALLANNSDLAHRLAIDLSSNLASAKLLVPLDPEFPILGGKTLKLSAGLELAYANGKPMVVLKGVSLWGVPVPNAWLGGLKNVDMVQEFGNQGGFWQAFAEGVESIEVQQGKLHIVLKE